LNKWTIKSSAPSFQFLLLCAKLRPSHAIFRTSHCFRRNHFHPAKIFLFPEGAQRMLYTPPNPTVLWQAIFGFSEYQRVRRFVPFVIRIPQEHLFRSSAKALTKAERARKRNSRNTGMVPAGVVHQTLVEASGNFRLRNNAKQSADDRLSGETLPAFGGYK